MDKYVECPYCGYGQNIDHEDGYGYNRDEVYNQECCKCGKTFIYRTSIFFYYHAKKEDCLNDREHEWMLTWAYPKCLAKMRCKHCYQEREPTEEERKAFGLGTVNDYLKQ
ncbi:MAG: hypothetical protein LBU37_09485 [Tannerellaceae bacterium]|jgi:hypothetical protein|nr:hypothetical protein [Tannerellaceae bacterium]